MKYYSTNRTAPDASLAEAVVRGLAPDRGLYMPRIIPSLPADFFDGIAGMSLVEIATAVSSSLFGDDIDRASLEKIVTEALNFPIPVVRVDDRRYALELFHGPTLAFKDVGARFMARILSYFRRQEGAGTLHVLVATSGDTGGAVAAGFHGVDGIRVHVLFPKGKVSPLQEAQFATLGGNVSAIEIDGTFDDCQRLVKSAFVDDSLTGRISLTSANSINLARFLPQMIYYFHALAQLRRQGVDTSRLVVAVPSGNFGNLAAALIGRRMGLPVPRFIAANNANRVFEDYLESGEYSPRPSIPTVANAMDVGDPSNFARILDLYGGSRHAIAADIEGYSYSDRQIRDTIASAWKSSGYLLDPHGATAFRALGEHLRDGETGLFLATAHPAKFIDTVSSAIGAEVPVPPALAAGLARTRRVHPLPPSYPALRSLLLSLS